MNTKISQVLKASYFSIGVTIFSGFNMKLILKLKNHILKLQWRVILSGDIILKTRRQDLKKIGMHGFFTPNDQNDGHNGSKGN